MYEPFMHSIADGVLAYNRISKWELHLQHICNPNSVGEAVAEAAPEKGDIFIWIGFPGKNRVGFGSLTKRGVRTVYVNAEPQSNCFHEAMTPGVSEVWTYSWRNIDRCKPPGNSFLQRYVPPGFLGDIPYTVHPSASPQAIFFGDPQWRRACYKVLQQQLGKAMQSINHIWSRDAFHKFIRENSLFVHLHKDCDKQGPVTAARMSQLISAGAIIISMHSYPRDANEYDGIINFTSVEKMHSVYANISSLSREERSELGSMSRAAFAERFAADVIFRRAGIYKLMDKMLRHG